MHFPPHDKTSALMCVLDQDSNSRVNYQLLADQQGLKLRLFDSVASLRAEESLEEIAVLIMELEADPENVILLQRDLLKQDVPPAVILTTDDPHSDQAIESLGLSAIAVFARPWNRDVLSPHVNYAVLDYQERIALDEKRRSYRRMLESLTERQVRVLELAITGAPNKMIAKMIGVSQRTIETERARLLVALESNCYMQAMIKLGEYQILERRRRLQRLSIYSRLGIQTPPSFEEKFPFHLDEEQATSSYSMQQIHPAAIGVPKAIGHEHGITDAIPHAP